MADPTGPNPWRYATAGLELVGVLAVLIGIGYVIDRWQGTKPWGVMIAAGIGIVGGLYRMVRDAMKIARSMPHNKTHDDPRKP